MADTPHARGQRQVSKWLRDLPTMTGRSLTAIAKEIGVATSTLTKPANDPDHPHLTSLTTILKITDRFAIPGPEGIDLGNGRPAAGRQGFAAPEASPYLLDERDPFDQVVRDFIGERPGVDPWEIRTRALEGAGYMPGDVAIVDLNAEPGAGDVVVAQSADPRTGRTETVWRIFDPPFLLAAAREPMGYKPLHRDNVAMMGVVVASFRRRQGV